MSQRPNPYTPPSEEAERAHRHGSDGSDGSDGVLYCARIGDMMVVPPQGAYLPDRCVRCNARGRERLTKAFQWHENWVYLTLLVGVLGYLVVASFQRRIITVQFSLCERHSKLHEYLTIGGWGTVIGSLALMMYASAADWLVVKYASLLPIAVGAMVAVLFAPALKVTKVDPNYAWIKVGQPFLESLPWR